MFCGMERLQNFQVVTRRVAIGKRDRRQCLWERSRRRGRTQALALAPVPPRGSVFFRPRTFIAASATCSVTNAQPLV